MNDEGGAARERFAALVLSCVEEIPPGSVTTYGAVAELLREATGRGGPRQVAQVMALEGAAVPWWRCVRADGSLPEHLQVRAAEQWHAERTPMRASCAVDMRAAFVQPAYQPVRTGCASPCTGTRE